MYKILKELSNNYLEIEIHRFKLDDFSKFFKILLFLIFKKKKTI